jgi:NADH-quinone oxidoreductase subunit N
MNADYAELLQALLPETTLVFGALFVLFFDILWVRHRSANRLGIAVMLGLIALASAAYIAITGGTPGSRFGGVLMLDTMALVSRVGVFGLAALTLALLPGLTRLRHSAEFVVIILLATVGFSLMAAANQLLLGFLALEVASLSLYILAGFDKGRPESAEAALKYFLLGGMSSAFLLFGFSLLYGLTGSIELDHIALALHRTSMTPLLAIALVMVLVAFGFKAAAAPFHLWAPDVYQGAPAPAAALIASASKLAGFTLFIRLLWPGLHDVAGSIATTSAPSGWLTIVAVLSAASLLLGNFGALAQSNVRRLLAYSAIAHAGVMMLGLAVIVRAGQGPILYYAITYGLATVGAFGVIAVIDANGGCQRLTDLAGLHRRSPLLAGCLLVFILSLAGVPPLAGFFGKFSIFTAAFQLGGISGPAGWLALLALAMSAIGLYYYLIILKQALIVKSTEAVTPIKLPLPATLALIVAAALIVLLGVFPSSLLGLFI